MSAFATEEKPPDAPPPTHTYDRFDRTIVHINGQSAHVESRRRHAVREESDGNQGDEKDLLELRFSQGVFENLVYGPRDDEDAAFRRLESALVHRVNHLGLMFKLDGAQQKKLLQAGRGDLLRIRERINDLKKLFSEPDLIEDDHPMALREWASERINEAVALRRALALAAPFHQGSMLEKVLRRQLTPEQIIDYEQFELRIRTGATQARRKAAKGF